MDTDLKWWSTSWKFFLIFTQLQLVYSCPSQCICSQLPSNNLLSNLFLAKPTRYNSSLKLEIVNCSNVSLAQIPDDIPAEVVYLDLSQNSLVAIDNYFCNLTTLKSLDFSYNRIKTLQNGVFNNLSQLEDLVFKSNSISVIQSKIFENLTSVERIDLSENNLSSIKSQMFLGLSGLKFLNLSKNEISIVRNQTFQHLVDLEILDFSLNSLERLHLHIFDGLSNLKVLNLANNKLSYISGESFIGLHKLDILDLSNNNIQSTSDYLFNGLSSLHTLSLSNNILTSISAMTFYNISNLKNLHLDSNPLRKIDIPIFTKLHNLTNLTLTDMPYLTELSHDTFKGLDNLMFLNLSLNAGLSFINPHLFSMLQGLQVIDIHSNNITFLSALTFHRNTNLTSIDITYNPLVCSCDIAWLVEYSDNNTCATDSGDQIPISRVTNETFPCAKLTQTFSGIDTFYFKVGSSARLTCNVTLDPSTIVIWTTSRNQILTYHGFHPDAIKHHPDVAYAYQEREWVNSTSYHSEFIDREDRVILLSDSSLFIDYVMRSDNGPYKCEVLNAYYNVSTFVHVWLDYQVLKSVITWSYIIGICCSASFFVLIVSYTLVRACTIRVVNKRRREAIHTLLMNLDVYKRNQISRIRDHYNSQLTRVTDHYHCQLERLRNNYTMQTGRVRRGCSHQVDKIRDNYSTQVGKLKDYSSHQVEQLRSAYNNQALKVRDFGSVQFDRLRETCKQGQMSIIKIMETMNLDNCKGIIETECMRTESMIFHPEFEHDDDIQGLSSIGSESDYTTATDAESKSSGSQTPVADNKSSESDDKNSVSDDQNSVTDNLDPLIFMDCSEEQRNDQQTESVTLELDLGDISLETKI